MHHSHFIRQPLRLFLIGSTLLGQSTSQVQASAADSGTDTHHRSEQLEIDANGQVSSSSESVSSSVSLDSQHSHFTPGVDHSWPTHHHDSEYFPEYRKESYLNYVRGCNRQIQTASAAVTYYNNRVNQRERFTCYKYEQDRMDMNLNQPKMMENYTHAGFAKLEIPPNVQTILRDFWEANEWETAAKTEVWDPSNTYVNHWESPTKILDLASSAASGGVRKPLSPRQKWEIVRGVQKVLEAWTKSPLVLTSLYGIRIYQEGSILAPHVDRLPLVSSAILHIASSSSSRDEDDDVEDPWILEVIGHDGQAHNLTMQPGEMVLYESHSVIHGRPYPLKGKFYANLFVHFEPLGHTLRHAQTQADHDLGEMEEEEKRTASEQMAANAKAAYERAFQMEQQMHAEGENKKKRRSSELPHYVDPDKEVRWKQQFDYDKKPKVIPKPLRQVLVSVTPHNAAASGNLDALKALADVDRANLFKRDQNGWRPLHEAARSGHVEVVEYLLQEGAKVNERTNNGEGGTPLWWAEKNREKNREAIELLKKHGGLSLQPRVLDEKQKKDETKGNEDDMAGRQA